MTQNAVLTRISKLLALQTSRGATEAEAQIAAEHVQRLLQEHNLTLAQVEAVGGAGDQGSKREKRATEHRAMYTWQRSLMAGLADNNFCIHQIATVRNTKALYSGGRGMTSRCHLLVGRVLNVQVTLQTYEYLTATLRRLGEEAGYTHRGVEDLTNFYEGATARLLERLVARRRQAEAESDAKIRPTNGTGRELVLVDVYGSEADLNNDTLNGFPMGTTASRRRQREEKSAKRAAEEARLVAEGMEPIEAFYRSYGYGEQSVVYAAEWQHKQSRRRSGRGRTQNWTQGDARHHKKINSDSYKAGRQAGDSVGLDTQVGATTRRRLTSKTEA